MTTILILNAVSGLLGAGGLAGFAAWHRARQRAVAVQPLYVYARPTRAGRPQ